MYAVSGRLLKVKRDAYLLYFYDLMRMVLAESVNVSTPRYANLVSFPFALACWTEVFRSHTFGGNLLNSMHPEMSYKLSADQFGLHGKTQVSFDVGDWRLANWLINIQSRLT
jgi:hypothetical protein